MKKALYILAEYSLDLIYGPEEQTDIARLVDVYAPPQTPQSVLAQPDLLREVQIILSGWGAPTFDAAFLDAAPRLEAVFYGAGSIRSLVTEAFWDRGVVICSAWGMNAVPVAEYALSQILFSLKHGWRYALTVKQEGHYPRKWPVPGAYGSTIALISLGMIGRRVAELLKPFDLRVIAYDPFVKPEDAAALGVTLCSLEEAFRQGDVVSLHTPWLKETEGMITGDHFRLMKEGATFINTARGAVVNEPEMIETLQARPDLFALLDVTHPEPPLSGSPLYTLPNVMLTPHIAGAMNRECRRMGREMVNELRRYLNGEPLQWSIDRERAARLA
ncbi:MAG: hydroxyacid dehydrogenase [Anaerolineae bacterium]|nr:hydroxyacid dehydrogenase [Anaerolineae bacterium]